MFDPDDPYAQFSTLRRAAAVVPYKPTPHGTSYFVTRYRECLEVFGDSESYSTAFIGEALARASAGSTLVGKEGDPHRSGRHRLAAMLSSPAVARLFADELRAVARRLVAVSIGHKRVAELMAEFVRPYASQTMTAVLGLPIGDSERARIWSTNVIDKARHASHRAEPDDFEDALKYRIQAARSMGHPGLLGALASTDSADDVEVLDILKFLLVAGIDTVAGALGVCILAALEHPRTLRESEGDPWRARLIEEALRWEAPVLLTVRQVRAGSSLADASLNPGDTLYVLIGSANRDEGAFSQPDAFDPTRRLRRHLSFGFGPHLCPGRHLARAQIAIALDELTRVAPELRLAIPPDRIHVEGEIFRAPMHLPVTTLGQ